MTATHFKLEESGKEKMRRASIELGIRVLRAHHMDDAADLVGTFRPVGIRRLAAGATREVSAYTEWETVARSSRRCGLRYVASLVSMHRERDRHRGAIALLHEAADSIPLGDGDEDPQPETRR